jgi:uncharacterized protein (UPF0261 family)
LNYFEKFTKTITKTEEEFMATIVLIGSLDTKGREYDYVRTYLKDAGANVIVVDFGILGTPFFQPDIQASEVAKEGGANLEDLRYGREGSDTRAKALSIMEIGVTRIVQRLYKEGNCDAVFGMGGSGGSSVISGAMRSLPIGIPKLLVSTMASGNVSGYIGTRDICLMYSVTDIAGLNRVSRKILNNAAAAILGMANNIRKLNVIEDRPLIAITMFGITTPGVLRVIERLEAEGFETIVFHATGSGGKAMEEMIQEGLIDGVIDYTTSELVDEYLGGIFSAGPNRLESAGRVGIPQVVVPGAMEVLNFGARNTVPDKYDKPERKIIVHNPNVCAVRTNKQESYELGKIFASKLNLAKGPTAILLPLKGLDKYEQPPDGPWIDPEADRALFIGIKENIRKDIPIFEYENNINDKDFADAAVDKFIELWKKAHQGKGN